jgi:hypothetical protein
MTHWTTTVRKTEVKMVGDSNRPPSLILEWKMMTTIMMMMMTMEVRRGM